MSNELEDTQGLSLEELALEGTEEGDEREQTSSLINANLAEPVNAVDVANLQSDDASAHADAAIDQSR